MNSQKIRLSALDTLFFRDGRPFTMGDDSWANTIFPPFPSTIYGMLRSLYFEKYLGELSKAETKNDPSGDIYIKELVLQLKKYDAKNDKKSLNQKSEELIFPLPLDIIENKDDKMFVLLQLKKNNIEYSSNQLEYKLMPSDDLFDKKLRSTKGEYYITETDFIKYLNNDLSSIKPFKLSDYLTNEPKIGIQRNRFNMDDKKMYRINQTRPAIKAAQFNIIVNYETPKMLDTNKYKRLGGEGKLVYIKNYTEENVLISISEQIGDVVKMYLATPAIISEDFYQSLKESNLKIIAAVTGNFKHIGGWNMKDNKPRKMYATTPAGSVFYLTGNKEKLSKFVREYYSMNLKQPKNFAKQGFGKVYFSKVNNPNN